MAHLQLKMFHDYLFNVNDLTGISKADTGR